MKFTETLKRGRPRIYEEDVKDYKGYRIVDSITGQIVFETKSFTEVSSKIKELNNNMTTFRYFIEK